jgi:hypothetical protein
MPAEAAAPGAPVHTFTPAYTVCANCHDGTEAQAFLTPDLSNQVSFLIFTLNRWAALKAPAALQTNGVVAWEYTTPGGLNWTTDPGGYVTGWTLGGPVTFTGPSAAGQALVPTNILKARYNLYLVLNDGSFGVHNPILALNILDAAQNWVYQELEP